MVTVYHEVGCSSDFSSEIMLKFNSSFAQIKHKFDSHFIKITLKFGSSFAEIKIIANGQLACNKFT